MGGKMALRPLQFLWIVDCSASMETDGKIEALNTAIREAIPSMRDVADNNPHAQILVRVLKFSSGAEWHVAQPTSIENFQWADLNAAGVTDMGKALKIVAGELDVARMPPRSYPPVLALVSDGMPTDDFDEGLRQLMAQPWGKKAVRLAIAIGRDADTDRLQQFIGYPELKPLQANNPEQLAKYIRFVSTVVGPVSQPRSRLPGTPAAAGNVVLPTAPQASFNPNDPW
jgi:uncharacterized protein YegL